MNCGSSNGGAALFHSRGEAMKLDDMGLRIIHTGVMCIGVLVLLVQLPFLLMQSHSWIDREKL